MILKSIFIDFLARLRLVFKCVQAFHSSSLKPSEQRETALSNVGVYYIRAMRPGCSALLRMCTPL